MSATPDATPHIAEQVDGRDMVWQGKEECSAESPLSGGVSQ